jgi:parallel beta-helix repeat protein
LTDRRPIIDRRTAPPNRRPKRQISQLTTVVFVLVLVLAALLQIPRITETTSDTDVPLRVAYTMHGPICIDGNAGFLGDNSSTGISWGGGTASDPYIIEGWDINASSAHGIEIRDSDAYFSIRGCYIHDGYFGLTNGIYLLNCRNGFLEDNICTNNWRGMMLYNSSRNILHGANCSYNYGCGIQLQLSTDNAIANNSCFSNNDAGIFLSLSSDNNDVSDNNCTDSWRGISITGSDSNSLWNNTCSGNGRYGVFLYSSHNITLSDNTCSDNSYGVTMDSSGNNTLVDNVFVNEGITIVGSSLSHWSTHTIDESNTVNQKPVRYYRDMAGLVVPDGAGQVLLANCTDFRVEGQTLCDTTIGIALAFSSDNLISGNNCSSECWGGIALYSSHNNSLRQNTCSGSQIGIFVDLSSNNTILNNTCNSNQHQNIGLQDSDNNALTNNTCLSCYGGSGMLLYGSVNNTLSGNNCSVNKLNGIWIYLMSNCNTLTGNDLFENLNYGILLQSQSNENLIWNNTFVGNHGAGSTYDPLRAQAGDDSTGNWWNSANGYGNYWSDWTTPDNDANGIVDNPYEIYGSAESKDYYPMTAAPTGIPEFSSSLAIIVVIVVMIALMIAVNGRGKRP